jgi:hypothetical protein
MKLRRKTLLAVVVLTGFAFLSVHPTPAKSATTPNLAPNSSFEYGGSGPNRWEGLHGADYVWSSAEARTGNHSVCITNILPSVSTDWLSDRLPVRPGQTYRIGAWAKGDSDRDATVGVYPADANGNFLTGQAVFMPYNDSSWTFSERFFTADADWRWMRIALDVNNPGGFTSDSVCFDDVVLQEVDSIASAVVPTSGIRFGSFRWNPQCTNDSRAGCHSGLDIATTAPIGTEPVRAMRSGTVIIASCSRGGYGWRVVIDHGAAGEGNHLFGHYAHMGLGDGGHRGNAVDDCDIPFSSYLEVDVGDTVELGQPIGFQGNSGAVLSESGGDAIHLHFSLTVSPTWGLNSGLIDPADCIGRARTYVGGERTFLNSCPAG